MFGIIKSRLNTLFDLWITESKDFSEEMKNLQRDILDLGSTADAWTLFETFRNEQIRMLIS